MKHPPTPSSGPASEGVRLDAWLWAARFHKTRSLAKQAVETGKVEVDGQTRKPSASLRVDAALRIVRGEETFEVVVLALSTQRGPASIAQALYRETDASRAAREAAREQRRAEANGYRPPPGKPDKRARRLIHALGDIDAS
ncbi:MAG TPA: S4 domain-containing protein [Xanthomonadaceae bacterium]|jgi:ribosome-associated heat shock protein Hsp15